LWGIGKMTNQSRIATKEICEKCAGCCKEFNYIVDEDSAKRFIMLDTDKIEVKEIRANSDNIYYSVKFKYPCRKLKVKDGKYYCSIYDGELPRPHMCEEYPDNTPLALLDYEKEKCPALKEWIGRKIILGDKR
jgi:Fe-S-cluster containining protein